MPPADRSQPGTEAPPPVGSGPAAQRDRRRTWKALACGLALAGLACVFGPSLANQARNAVDLRVWNDDTRQVLPALDRLAGIGPGGADVLAEYELALLPSLYRLGMRAAAWVVEPLWVTRLLPLCLLALLLFAVTRVAHRLGGLWSAGLTVGFTLSTHAFLLRLGGGLPRSFAFPCVALGLWFLVAGRVLALAVLTVVAAGLYPVAGALLGLALAALLFVVPREDRGVAAGWSTRRRIAWLLATGGVALAVLLPMLAATRAWGPPIGPGDLAAFPEAGPGGRYDALDGMPFRDLMTEAAVQWRAGLLGDGLALIPALREAGAAHGAALAWLAVVITAAGWIVLAARRAEARRALALPAAAVTGFCLAWLCAPWLFVPQRYLAYTLPLLLVAFLPAGAAVLGAACARRWTPWGAALGALLFGGGMLALTGGRGSDVAGYAVYVPPETGLYRAVAALPADALVAGFPDGPIDNVPLLARRRALLTSEMHQAFHVRYVLEMRRRMARLLPALFGPEYAALARLRDELGVTHLLVDTAHFAQPPRYFVPFGTQIELAWKEGQARGFAAERAMRRATIFSEGTLVLLDLARL